MKKLTQLIAVIALLGFASCKSGYSNFNRQKYTDLRGIKPAYETKQLESEETAEINERGGADFGDALLSIKNVEDPKVTLIKKAIEDGEQIIVVVKGKKYELQNPIYDGIYQAVTGVLVEVEEEGLAATFYEVKATEFSSRLGSEKIFDEHIVAVTKKNYYQNSRTIKDVEQSNSIEDGLGDEESSSIPNTGSDEESEVVQTKSALDELNQRFPKKNSLVAEKILEGSDYTYTGDYVNPHYRAGRRNFRAALFCLLPLFSGIALLSLGLFTIGFFALVGGVVIGLAVLIGLIFLLRSAVALKRLKRTIGKERFAKLSRARAMRTLGILGLMLLGFLPFFIPFFIFMAIVSGQSKRRARSY